MATEAKIDSERDRVGRGGGGGGGKAKDDVTDR